MLEFIIGDFMTCTWGNVFYNLNSTKKKWKGKGIIDKCSLIKMKENCYLVKINIKIKLDNWRFDRKTCATI